MRTPLDRYELIRSTSLIDVLATLATGPDVRPFAGGTDLMVLMEAGHLPPGRYVDLWGLSELRTIEDTPDTVVIGALTTYTDVLRSAILRREFPMLSIAASETGGVATQNRGTLGGNIANGSPAADTPPALLVYDAALELQSVRGARRVPYDRFHSGYKKMDLRRGEIITRIHLPKREPGWRDYYRKVGTRRAQAISKVCFSGSIRMSAAAVADVRVAVGSVAPIVVRAARTEQVLRGTSLDIESTVKDAESALVSEIAPIDDIRSTADYRLRVARNLLGEFLRQK